MRKLWKRAGFTCLVIVLLVFAPQTCARAAAGCMGYDDELVAAIESCPQAVDLLGDEIGPARVGLACGNSTTEGGSGNASWRMAFAGSRDRGSLTFDAEMHGGTWSLTRAVLHAGDHTVDLLACERTTHAAEATRSLADVTIARCAGGAADACVSAGAMYEAGHLVPRDLDRARELYHRGCLAGHAPACRLESTLSNRRDQ
jgi:hypothetical protein